MPFFPVLELNERYACAGLLHAREQIETRKADHVTDWRPLHQNFVHGVHDILGTRQLGGWGQQRNGEDTALVFVGNKAPREEQEQETGGRNWKGKQKKAKQGTAKHKT